MPIMQTLIAIPLLLVLAAATVIDGRTHRLPNLLTLGAALFGLILQISINGAAGLGLSLGGWLLCLIAFVPFYIGGGMAAGDVKLMAAVGAFIGPFAGLAACLFSMIAGGIVGIAGTIQKRRLIDAITSNADESAALRDALRTRIPYAGAIAAGTSFILLVPSAIPSVLRHLGTFA